MQQMRAGFTLVELSLVLVIIGLVVGGILGGQSLVRSGETKALIADQAKYADMFYAFRDKYKAMPGDMADAFDYWGAACGTNATTASAGCNGDGNGLINTSLGENIRSWEHLSLAGLVGGAFNGTGTVEGSRVVASASNVPKAAVQGVYWDLTDAGNNVNGSDLASRTLLIAGALCGTGSCVSLTQTNSPLTNGDGRTIDLKLDDGKSDTGKMRGSSTCADNGADPYRVGTGENVKGCALTFMLQ